MHKDNWDDLRFVLAVADSGSVSAAARALGVNHATVLRRIAAWEERHGIELFEKSARGYAISPEKLRVVEAAREVESAVYAVDRLMQGAQAPLRGTVRVTSTDTLCLTVLPPIVERLKISEPELIVDLFCTNAHLDLARLDAEITVRPSKSLPQGLVGDSPAALRFEVYEPLKGSDRWLGFSGALTNSVVAGWLTSNVPKEAIAGTADSFVVLRELAACGAGSSILPVILGQTDPRLRRVDGMIGDIAAPLWVACHADLAGVGRVQAVRAALMSGLEQAQAALDGAG